MEYAPIRSINAGKKTMFSLLIWFKFWRTKLWSFENDAHQASHKKHFLPTVEIKDYNVMVDGKNVFDQLINNDINIYINIRKITIGQGDNYATSCLLDYLYFKENYSWL